MTSAPLTHKPLSADEPRLFSMQCGPDLPWEAAQPVWEAYEILYGNSQSMKRMNERGGFGWAEVEVIFSELYQRDREAFYRLAGKDKIPGRRRP